MSSCRRKGKKGGERGGKGKGRRGEGEGLFSLKRKEKRKEQKEQKEQKEEGENLHIVNKILLDQQNFSKSKINFCLSFFRNISEHPSNQTSLKKEKRKKGKGKC